MTKALAMGKRLGVMLYTLLTLFNWGNAAHLTNSWVSHWTQNANKILTLTMVNTAITTGSEFITRSILSPTDKSNPDYKFITSRGTINRQSLINIWMTFFASLLGAPVFFFAGRFDRFLYFVLFGTFNSLLSQSLISMYQTSSLMLISSSRLLFDFFYNGSVKFIIFEFFRKPIIADIGIFKLTYLRGKQDVMTTFFKNTILNLLGFKG